MAKVYEIHVLGWAVFTKNDVDTLIRDTQILPIVGYSLGGPQIDGIKNIGGDYRLRQILPADNTYKIGCQDEDCECTGTTIGFRFPGDDTDWDEAQRVHAKVSKPGYKLGQD